MKFQPKKQIPEGAIRIVKRFAFFPITEWIPTDKKGSATRGSSVWMETVYIKQRRAFGYDGPDYWSNQEFVTVLDYLNYKRTSI